MLLSEGRTIGSTLRREYPKLFAFRVDEEEDRLAHRIRDGVRYKAGMRLGKKVREGIKKKRAAEKDADEATVAVKRVKITYMVDAKRFHSSATKDQLAQEFTIEDLGKEETHQILQCKVR